MTNIARTTGRNKSTISRKLCRNIGQRENRAGQKGQFARKEQKNCTNGPRFCAEVLNAAQARLREDWIPEHISGRFALDGTGQISKQTVHDIVRADTQAGGDFHTHPRSQKKRRKRYGSGPSRRGRIPNRAGIERRPKVVGQKARVGDWEGYWVVGRSNHQAIASLVDRKIRLRLLSKGAGGVNKSITFDIGLGFQVTQRLPQRRV